MSNLGALFEFDASLQFNILVVSTECSVPQTRRLNGRSVKLNLNKRKANAEMLPPSVLVLTHQLPESLT